MDRFVKITLDAEVKVFQKEMKKLEVELASDTPNSTEIEARVHSLRQQKIHLFIAQDKALEILLKTDEDGYLAERERRADYQTDLERLEVKARDALQEDDGNTTVDRARAATPDLTRHRANLPKRKLLEFNGDVREWLGFWSSFEDIDKDAALTENDKFQYLLTCIPKTSSARKVIDGFTVSAKNYRTAIDTLKNMYGRGRMLIKVFVRDLLQLVIENATKGASLDFLDLYPKLSSHIRNLGELGVTSDKCEEILYPVVESCLPEDILQAWQRNANFDEKLDVLMAFLNTEVNNKMDRSLAKMQFNTTTVSTERNGKAKKNERKPDQPAAVAFLNANASDKDKKKRIRSCVFCGDSRHESKECGKAKLEMSLDEKKEVLDKKNCCRRCLIPGHFQRRCNLYVRCCICGGRHYEVICDAKKEGKDDNKNFMMAAQFNAAGYQVPVQVPVHAPVPCNNYVPPAPPQQQPQSGQSNAAPGLWSSNSNEPRPHCSNISVGENERITLSTLVAYLETPTRRWKVRVFIDPGSDASYVKKEIVKAAELPLVGVREFRRQLFGGVITKLEQHPKYQVTLTNLDGRSQRTFALNSIERIAHKIAKPIYGPYAHALAQRGITFHDQSDAPDDVQIMLGMDSAAQIWTGGFHRINPFLYAQETEFGWVVGGSEPGASENVSTSNMVTMMMVNEQTVENLWALEAMGIREDSTSETKEDLDKATTEFFEKTVVRKDDGRYVVHLPWKDGHKQLRSNFHSCIARLKKVTSDLRRGMYWESYDKIFRDWEEEGIIEEVPDMIVENLNELYLLPHRHVIKESSSTTPVRPVFDASARGKGGPSLNECLATGPNLLELIPAIMCRFRKEKVGAVSDIKKAFLQIEVNKKDQGVLQFLWWKDSSCKQLKLYRHCRVVFGVKPSPFLLAATLCHHVKNECEDPEFSSKLLDSLYVDNSCSSHPTMQKAVEFQNQSQELLLPAKFDLRGWEFSNSSEEKFVPVLGMTWETKSDAIRFCLDSVKSKLHGPNTKRNLLAVVNSLFDPMGFACGFTIDLKLLLQDCCKLNLGWDDELPGAIAEKFTKWKSQVLELENLKIPRWVGFQKSDAAVSVHCFCDASGFAFATTIYLRVHTGNCVGVQLLMAKSRVAPAKKKVTIPRLELLGCGIGARLTANHVVKFLELEDCPTFYWTDSTTALTWIQRDKDWARFVANRVDAIRKVTRQQDWNHVPGELNPADVPSRGCSAQFLIEKNLNEGPLWLRKPADTWPNSRPVVNEELVNEEVKKEVVAFFVQREATLLDFLLHHSDYHKILRIMAFIMRYISILRKRSAERKNGLVGELRRIQPIPATVKEIGIAEKHVLRMIQHEAFYGTSDKKIVGMEAFKDIDGLIRVKSKLVFGQEDFGVKYLIVLPHNHPMVKVIIFKEHCVHCHAGVQILQANLRERFWILKGRRAISGVVTACPVCKRFIAKRCEVPAAPLPLDRIKQTVAFDVTGVDLAGPLFLKGGTKAWVVLFTCGVYRAVHLELVTTLSTQGFLNAFRRFVARRGRPSRVYSDNGLNFVGCANLFKQVEWDEVQRYAAVDRISWRFNPPTAAWWGGWWERLIGLCKQLIRRILGKKIVEFDELQTVLCDVEAVINMRPLTYVSDRKEELLPLCPAHFLKDNPNNNIPEADVVDAKALRDNVKICQALREELRSRFRKEYLWQLQHHAEMKTLTVKPGDVVIVEDDNKKRLEWSLGVIVEVYPGRDGQIRTARVKTMHGMFLRAVQRLFLMEVADSEPEKEEQVMPAPLCEEIPEAVSPEEKITRFGRKVKVPDRLEIHQ